MMPRGAARRRPTRRGVAGTDNRSGGVAVEFALTAPVIILIVAGIADFGTLEIRTAALTGATQIGANYALLHPNDTTGIENAMQTAMDFNPPLTFPSPFRPACECADGMPIGCSLACATMGLPGPNRVFITVSASQSFNPLIPWPGLPATLTASTELRLR